MSYEYNEIVKTISTIVEYRDNTKEYDYIWNCKIEIYKQNDKFYSRLFKRKLYSLILTDDSVVVSDMFYVDKSYILPILREKSFQSIDECLNFALEQVHSLKLSNYN